MELGVAAEKIISLFAEACAPADGAAVVAIDGRCASGKSTLARAIAEKTPAGIVHMDDFFLPMELRTPERYAAPGGNFHIERFQEEVLPRIRSSEAFSYGVFDCKKMAINGAREVAGAKLRVVEGAYSLHPSLGRYYDLAVFADVDSAKQLLRIEARGGKMALEAFKSRWIPLEEAYFLEYGVEAKADITVTLE